KNKDPYKAEYNTWNDLNKNGVVDQNECLSCWDLNGNGKADINSEDINSDGVINEVDCQVKGASIRHGVNIITFIIGIMLFYLFLSTCIFSDYKDLAFLSALLFLMHPLHTEVIANVKSRDEIFSLIFISLTFFYSFKFTDYEKYLKTPGFFDNTSAELKKIYFVLVVLVSGFMLYLMRKSGVSVMVPSLGIAGMIIYRSYLTFFKNQKYSKAELLLWASFSFFLSLLSKEYAVTLLVLIPAGMYIFYKKPYDIKPELKNAGLALIAFFLCAVFMLVIKHRSDIDPNPNHKANMSYWLMPFLYLIVGVFIISNTMKRKNFPTLMSWLYFVTLFYLGMRLVAVKL
ncbi:MAG: hypothetical protein O9353_00585, partial [Bacteroidia bacterium]|nr:hypothetical protein [Bacteroidia bacterium]